MRVVCGFCVVEPLAQCKDPRGVEDDLTLVHAIKRGHASAFENLVRKYDGTLLRIVQSVTHNREEAEDVVQEALFRFIRDWFNFKRARKFPTWLIHIVLNEGPHEATRQRAAEGNQVERVCYDARV